MVDVVLVGEAGQSLAGGELWPLYRRVFKDFDDAGSWRTQVWDRHAARTGFRLALARDHGALVGFAYGYTGEPGQWWTDNAAKVLHPDVASDWLGGHFELVSIGVDESARGAGVGRQLMAALTEGLGQSRWVLMTSADPEDPRPASVPLSRLGRDRPGAFSRTGHHGSCVADAVTRDR